MPAAKGARSRAWASGLGVALIEVSGLMREALLLEPGVRQALLDGVDRGLTGDPPAIPPVARVYALRDGRRTLGDASGIVVVARDCPRPGEASLLAVAVAPVSRGRALATKALLLAERQLIEEGSTRVFARVPRTNGRGLYFMLRCGFTPVTRAATVGADEGDATWFARKAPSA